MDRRNFFMFGGIAGLALSASASQALAASAQPMSEVAKILAGTPLDKDIIKIAQTVEQGGGGAQAARRKGWYVIVGNRIAIIIIGVRAWTKASAAFGGEFRDYPLSKMIETVAASRFGRRDYALSVDRDGEVYLSA